MASIMKTIQIKKRTNHVNMVEQIKYAFGIPPVNDYEEDVSSDTVSFIDFLNNKIDTKTKSIKRTIKRKSWRTSAAKRNIRM